MKRHLLTLAALLLALTSAKAGVAINEENFPDEWFRRALVGSIATDDDDYLTDEEIAAINDYFLDLSGVLNFKGIEYFYDGLKYLIINPGDDEPVTNLDFSKFKVLESLDISSFPGATSLDFSHYTKLRELHFTTMKNLSSLQVPATLEVLLLNHVPNLTAIDLTPCKNSLGVMLLYTGGKEEGWWGGLKELDLTGFSKLDYIVVNGGPDCHYPMEKLVFAGCDNMSNFTLDYVDVDEVTLKNLQTINAFSITNCGLKLLDIENCPKFGAAEFENNDLTQLNIRKCPELWRIFGNNNRMQTLIADDSPVISQVWVEHNRLMWLDMSGVVKDPNIDEDVENWNFKVDDQQPTVQAVKISPTETGLRVHDRLDVSRVLNLRAKGIAQTPKEIFVDGIRYFVFYDNGPDTPNLVGSDCFYEYETKWPYAWREGNSKDNNLPVTLNVTSWTKHQAFLTLSQSRVEGKYGEPAPAAPTVTRSQDYDGKITFSSSNENVVKVNADTGELTVIGAGTAIISVSGAETDYRLAPLTKTYTVFIEKATPVIAFPAAEINATYGETVPLNPLTVTWYEGTVTYASANEKKATVTAEGVVTTLGAGDVTIKGIAPETSNFKRLEVTYVLHIAKASPVFAFEKDGLTALLGEAVPENKLSVGLYDGEVQYASSDETIATVDAQGVVTPLAVGEVTITATGAETENCNAARQAQYKLTIADPTGIAQIENGKSQNGTYYDMQGRRVNPQTARKGVYVVNGKKVVRKWTVRIASKDAGY